MASCVGNCILIRNASQYPHSTNLRKFDLHAEHILRTTCDLSIWKDDTARALAILIREIAGILHFILRECQCVASKYYLHIRRSFGSWGHTKIFYFEHDVELDAGMLWSSGSEDLKCRLFRKLNASRYTNPGATFCLPSFFCENAALLRFRHTRVSSVTWSCSAFSWIAVAFAASLESMRARSAVALMIPV